jgi:hypothetical protein
LGRLPEQLRIYSNEKEERAIVSVDGLVTVSPAGSSPWSYVIDPQGVYRWDALTAPSVTPANSWDWYNYALNAIKLRERLTIPLADCTCAQTSDLDLFLWYGDSKHIGSMARGIPRHAGFARWTLTWSYSPPYGTVGLSYLGACEVPKSHRDVYGEGGREFPRGRRRGWAPLPGGAPTIRLPYSPVRP